MDNSGPNFKYPKLSPLKFACYVLHILLCSADPENFVTLVIVCIVNLDYNKTRKKLKRTKRIAWREEKRIKPTELFFLMKSSLQISLLLFNRCQLILFSSKWIRLSIVISRGEARLINKGCTSTQWHLNIYDFTLDI